jgi:hypothetical protein
MCINIISGGFQTPGNMIDRKVFNIQQAHVLEIHFTKKTHFCWSVHGAQKMVSVIYQVVHFLALVDKRCPLSSIAEVFAGHSVDSQPGKKCTNKNEKLNRGMQTIKPKSN